MVAQDQLILLFILERQLIIKLQRFQQQNIQEQLVPYLQVFQQQENQIHH